MTTSLTITFTGSGEPPKFRHKGDHMQIVPPRQLIACFHCGDWINPYMETSSLGISIPMYCAISTCFGKEHRRCRPQPQGKENYVYLKNRWDSFMREFPKEREKWEKDHNTTWQPTDWAKEYDEWVSLPFKKKERKK